MPCAIASEKGLLKDRLRNDQLIEVRSRTVKNVSFAFRHATAARMLSAMCVSTVCVIVRFNACVWWDIPSKQRRVYMRFVCVFFFE